MTRAHVAATILAALCTNVLLAQESDVIRLKTGATLEGAITEQDEDTVTIQIEGGSMRLRRSQIADIKVAERPEDGAPARLETALSLARFSDEDTFHFLYRDGRRVGYRVVSLKRENQNGIPGYTLLDRLVFTSRPGAQPDVDLQVREFVDVELQPVSFEHRFSSGPSGRIVSGHREGLSLVMKERVAGELHESTALFRKGVQFPGMLLRRLATEPPPEGAYPEFRVFRPGDLAFSILGLDRRVERVSLRGRIRDVLVFRRKVGDRELEVWLDMSGRVVREELGSPRLVALQATEHEVNAFARGENVPEGEDLGLECIHEPTGFRLLRPDLAWEVTHDESQGLVMSLLRPGLRATADILRLDEIPVDATEEGITLDVLARMERQATDLKVEGPYPMAIGAHKGIRFETECMRRGSRVRTMGSIILDGRGHAFVILCAAPESSFQDARPGFIELIDSVEILPPVGAEPSPFDTAETGVGTGR